MTDKVLRWLGADDIHIFREIRLRALQEHPDAFLVGYEEALRWPLEKFADYLKESRIVGVFVNNMLVGFSGLWQHRGDLTRHRADLWGVYVAPEARGQSFAKRLIEMLLEQAKQLHIEVVLLSTNVENPVTIGIYESLGFEKYGVERHILKLADGRYVDDVLMQKWL